MLFNLYLKGYYCLSGYFVIADNFYSSCKRYIIFKIASALLKFSRTIAIPYFSSITLIISTISNELMIRDYQAIQKNWFIKGHQRKIPTYGKNAGVKLIGILRLCYW